MLAFLENFVNQTAPFYVHSSIDYVTFANRMYMYNTELQQSMRSTILS